MVRLDPNRLALGGIAALALSLLIGIATILVLPIQPSLPEAPSVSSPTREIRIHGGELGTHFGFGISRENVTSPGPTLRIRLGETTKIIFVNIGQIPHTFVIVQEPKEDSPILFGASIGSPTRPIMPGKEAAVIFRADRPGKYYYICNVPGHVLLGMLGNIIVEG